MWKSTTFAVLFAVPVMTKGGCDGCDPSGGNGTIGTDTGVTVDPCDSYTGQATDAELAATPRARPELEQLAIALFPSFTADPDVYARLADDLDAIGDLAPDLAGISYRSAWRGDQLIVGVDAATAQKITAGTYDAWDCANDTYEISDVQPMGVDAFVLTFPGTYDIEKMADEYAGFTGVSYAEPNYRIGDGSTVCVVPDGDTWHWRIDEASGDCPAGCIDHTWSYFVSDANGVVTAGGSWSNDMPPMTQPGWMARFDDCR